MIIDDLRVKRNMSKYSLAVEAGIPYTTLNDICSGLNSIVDEGAT